MTRRLRILHLGMLYPPHVMGGAERSVAALAEAQAAAGHIVAAACITPGEATRETRNGVIVHRMPHESDFWPEDWAAHSRLARLWRKVRVPFNHRMEAHFAAVIAEFRPDIVHSHSMLDVTTLCWPAAARAGVPIVHTVREYDLLCLNTSLYHHGHGCGPLCRVTALPKRRHQRAIGAVAGLSHAVIEAHRARGSFLHLPDDRIVIIPNGIGPAPAPPRPPSGTGPFRFGYLGRISPEKGVDTLIAAASLLPADGSWEIVIGGTGSAAHVDPLRDAAAGMPIRFLGHVEPAGFLDGIDVLVVPSVWIEPFGRIILEAWRAGRAVLGARIGGIAETIARFGEEWLFPPGDETALAARMAELIDRAREALPPPESFAPLLADYTEQHVAEAYDALYARLLKDDSNAGRSAVDGRLDTADDLYR